MSSAPNELEVVQQVTWLEQLPGERDMRDRSERFHQLATMQLRVELPQHVGRGDTRELPLADLLDMAYSIQAERHGYQTSVTLTAVDNTPQTTVDRIEKWIAMRVSQHLRRWLMTDEAGFHQLLTYAGIICWYSNGPNSTVHSRIDTPDPFSSYFPVRGAGRPKVFGRRFRMLVRDAEEAFGQGNWDAYALGDDHASRGWSGSSFISTGTPGFAREAEFLYHDNGEYCTYMALNRQQGGLQPSGDILWQDKNYAGPDEDGNKAAAAIVVPGFVTPMRQPRDRLLPMFIPGIQAVNALHFILSTMATKAEQNTGDVLVEQDADMLEAAARMGKTAATMAELEAGNPSIVPVAGKPIIWERLPDPYLQALLEFWKGKYDSWANSLREIADPTLLSQINTNVYLPHAAARRKLMGPMLDYTDAAMKELVRMDLHALQFYGRKDVKLVAQGGERYGSQAREVSRGEASSISWADVKDFDERFILSVSTNSMSQEEQRQRLMAHEEKVMMGYATKRQGLALAGFTDEEEQLRLLATDEVYRGAAGFLQPQLPDTIAEAVRTAGGPALPVQGPTAPAPAVAPPGPPGGNNVTYNTPPVPGPAGQSQPLVAA